MFIGYRQKYIPATPLLHLHCSRHVLLSLLAFEYPLNAKSEMKEVKSKVCLILVLHCTDKNEITVLQMISNVHVFIE